MAVPNQTLKSNTFFTLDEVKDYLGIKIEETKFDNKVIRLINMVTALAENYIDGPILTREFTEVRDGDSSNVIVPDHWPVRSITELRIDYNGDFTPAVTIIPPDNYTIRGASDLEIGIKGTDVVVRNDGNLSIIGRLFIGSVVSSIQLKYKAGWGEAADDLPEDLKYACLMGIEYFYILRENRELNIKSKTNEKQAYTRDSGLPKEVCDILDDFRDTSLGRTNRPQKNAFTI